jgi:hypothetical protein
VKVYLIIVMWCWSVVAHAQWQRIDMSDAEAQAIEGVDHIGRWTLITRSREVWRALDIADRPAWQQASGIPGTGIPGSLRSLRVTVHNGKVYAVAHDTLTRVYVSTDSAQTFNELVPAWTFTCADAPTSEPRFAIASHGTALYAACWQSSLWRSLDDGATWTVVDPFAGERTTFRAVDSAVVVKYHQHDTGYVSHDYGSTWTPFPTPDTVQIIGIGNGATLFATVKTYKLRRSTDSGRSWSLTPVPDAGSSCPLFVVPVGMVDLTTGSTYRSTDSGSTWQFFADGIWGGGCYLPEPASWVESFHPTQDDLIARVHVGPGLAGTKPAWFRRSMKQVVLSVDGGQWTVDERVLRGSVPWTTVRVDRDVIVDVFNVLGERVSSYMLEPGEHLLDTPGPVFLIVKPLYP